MAISNYDALLGALQDNLAATQTPSDITDQLTQSDLIQGVIQTLGGSAPDVLGQVASFLANAKPLTCLPPEGPVQAEQVDVNGSTVTFSTPNPIDPPLPQLGTPNLEELFGANVKDPVDKLFINLAAAIAGIFGVFFGLSSIQSREVLEQFNAQRQTQILLPPDLADMVERNVVDFESAACEAAGSGINRERFKKLVDNTGEPYGLIEAIALWRRGKIGIERLYEIVAYSRVKTKYFTDLLQLSYEPMSPADVIEARLKNVIKDDTEAKKKFAIGGGDLEDYQIALDATGNAIGVEQAANLRNHGLIDDQQFEAVILHSRINPTFEPMAQLLRHRWLSPFQIHQALVAGTIDSATATSWLEQDGYSPDQAHAFATAAGTAKPAKAKEETESQILELYQTGFLPHDDAIKALNNLGYSDAITTYLLDLTDAKRIAASTNAAVTRLRTAFLARRVDLTTVKADLKALGVQAFAIEEMTEAWQVELSTNFKELTAAQWAALVKDGLVRQDYVLTQLQLMGYTAEGAALYLASHTKDPSLIPVDLRPPK